MESKVVKKVSITKERLINIASSILEYKEYNNKFPFFKPYGKLKFDDFSYLKLSIEYKLWPRRIILHYPKTKIYPELFRNPFNNKEDFNFYFDGENFLLVSPGPNNKFDAKYEDLFIKSGKNVEELKTFCYDPSNGTISSMGDIILDSRGLKKKNFWEWLY